MKPTLDALISVLEEKFGELTPQAKHCAEDFHKSYENFIDSIISKKITIVASPNLLADKLQESKYNRYRSFGGLSIFLFLIGLITLFVNWKIAIGIFVMAFISRKISTYLKFKSSQNFEKYITLKFSSNPDEGMFDICQYYIAGILLLSSTKGEAYLPLIPSYCLTGIEKYARSEN